MDRAVMCGCPRQGSTLTTNCVPRTPIVPVGVLTEVDSGFSFAIDPVTRFKVPRVITRIYDPAREDTFHEMGLETICPTTLVADRIYRAVETNSSEPLDDGVVEPLPGETLARTHTATMPVTESHDEEPPAGRRDGQSSWRRRLFGQ